MVKTVEVENELKELLREELEDPRSDRDKEWVFTEKPKVQNQYPYILISLLDVQKNGFTIGNTTQEHRHRIQVTVRVKNTNEFEINGEKRGAGYVKWYLTERIDEIIQSNQDRFRNLGNGEDVFTLLPDSGNPASPGNSRQTSNDYILHRKRT